MSKFTTEKRLHEIIRDLPEAAKVDQMLPKGFITIEDALMTIAKIVKDEKDRRKEQDK